MYSMVCKFLSNNSAKIYRQFIDISLTTVQSSSTLSNTVVRCGFYALDIEAVLTSARLRYTMSIKHTLNFKDLVQ